MLTRTQWRIAFAGRLLLAAAVGLSLGVSVHSTDWPLLLRILVDQLAVLLAFVIASGPASYQRYVQLTRRIENERSQAQSGESGVSRKDATD